MRIILLVSVVFYIGISESGRESDQWNQEILNTGRRLKKAESDSSIYGKQYPLPDPNVCGKPLSVKAEGKNTSGPQWKIMGGKDVPYGEIPWAVILTMDGYYACTGTLITKKHVISAAHCFIGGYEEGPGTCDLDTAYKKEFVLEKLRILYGGNCMNNSKDDFCANSPKMKEARVMRIDYLPFFAGKCTTGDYSLIELDHEIDESASYICLLHKQRLPKKLKTIKAYGWGYAPRYLETPVNILQAIEFPNLLPWNQCKGMLESYVPDDVLCTRETKTQNCCVGDSGGGLMTLSVDGHWVLIGVTSFGNDCTEIMRGTQTPRAQIYTKLRLYNAHIDRFTGLLSPWLIID